MFLPVCSYSSMKLTYTGTVWHSLINKNPIFGPTFLVDNSLWSRVSGAESFDYRTSIYPKYGWLSAAFTARGNNKCVLPRFLIIVCISTRLSQLKQGTHHLFSFFASFVALIFSCCLISLLSSTSSIAHHLLSFSL